MKKRVWVAIVVLLATTSVFAQHVTTSQGEILAFSSVELLVNCAAQMAMGDKNLILAAMITGDAFIVPKGSVIMELKRDKSGLFAFMIKGKPGIYYSTTQFIEK